MIKEQITVSSINSPAEFQEYDSKDLSLIQQFQITSLFGAPEDYVEYHVYDLTNTLIFSNLDAAIYKPDPSSIDPQATYASALQLFPDQDVKVGGIDRGTVTVTYNFFKRLLGSSDSSRFWIKEISADRTELKVVNQNVSNQDLLDSFTAYRIEATARGYFPDFLLNFGNNNTLIGVNLASGVDADEDVVVFVKLYEPLPSSFDTKSSFWFVEKLSEPAAFVVNIEVVDDSPVDTTPRLRGPNFSVDVLQKANQTLQEYTYEDLLASSMSSSFQQIKSLMEEKGVEINVDYTNFGNFIHFSSATDRISNFRYKLQLIESHSQDIVSSSVVTGNSTIVGSTKDVLQAKINNIIEKFDDYEYYLYFNSESYAWPKYTSQKPYSLYSVTSSQAVSWFQTSSISASLYDSTNKDLFINTIPTYLKDDANNLPYEIFLNMVGQHFDNIWVYLKDVTERYNANSGLTQGVSKDFVADTLRNFGINLYTNTNISDNLYYSILGFNSDGSLLPPTGSEKIKYYITSSADTMAAEDITLEYYKRIYHNLPYLLKTKGTERGIRALINCFGIPDTVLKINEYGGIPKDSVYTGYKQNRFALAYKNDFTSSIAFPWAPSYYQYLATNNANLVPDAIEFRFKTRGIPSSSYFNQTVFQVGSGAGLQFGIGLKYDPLIDLPDSPYEKYGYLTLYMNNGGSPLTSTPIHLPFFDNEQWWTVLLKRTLTGAAATGANTYTLYVKSSFYNEENVSRVGFEGSTTITTSNASIWNNFNASQAGSFNAYLGGADNNSIISPNNRNFNGYFQEFRYWVGPISEDIFDRHVLNSQDYSLSNATGSLFNLILRAPLGNDLTVPYRNSSGVKVNEPDYDLYLLGKSTINASAVVDTIHPAVTGSHFISGSGEAKNIQSFINGGAPYGYGTFSTGNTKTFVEQQFTDLVTVPTTGISQKINNKVIIDTAATGSFPAEKTLTTLTTLQRYDANRTISSPDLEIAFSPADVIDQDIINQLGAFNIDDFIGTPSDRYTKNYASLENLKSKYFSKYLPSRTPTGKSVNGFDVYDYIRLLKYIDNSLFKMIKDFTPARANLSTGVVIKSHILERPKYQRYEPEFTRSEYTSSIEIGDIEGTSPQGINYPTAYSQSIITPSGSTTKLQTPYLAQYTGEYQGSELTVVSGYFPQYDVSNVVPVNTQSLSVNRQTWYYITTSLDPLLNNVTQSRKSTRFYDVDYSTDAILPVNLGVISSSIGSQLAGKPPYTSPYTPWARVQDSNYSTKTYTTLRYDGSKTQSRLYSTYSVGDTSYGQTAAIDKIKVQYAYLKDIYTASLTLPSRSNAQIKYLIDDNEAVLDLTKENNNIFDVQNIYKGGESVNISLFDYTNQSTNLLSNKSIPIYEGGFRYVPIYHNITGAIAPYRIKWNFSQPQEIIQEVSLTSTTTSTTCQNEGNSAIYTNPQNWIPVTASYLYKSNGIVYGGLVVISGVKLSTVYPNSILPTSCDLKVKVGVPTSLLNASMCTNYDSSQPYQFVEFTVATSQGQRQSTSGGRTFSCPSSCQQNCNPSNVASNVQVLNGIQLSSPTTTNTTTVYQTTYVSSIDDPQPCLRVPPTSSEYPQYIGRTVALSQVASDALIRQLPIVFDSYSDPSYDGADKYISRIEKVVFPFSLDNGDAIHFYTGSIGWAESEEYRVVTTFVSGTVDQGFGKIVYVVLDRDINPNIYTTKPTLVPGQAPTDGLACRAIIAKHIPDETNVILRYNPLDPDLVEEGILYPQYILESVRKNAGNVIKSLKSQGLI